MLDSTQYSWVLMIPAFWPLLPTAETYRIGYGSPIPKTLMCTDPHGLREHPNSNDFEGCIELLVLQRAEDFVTSF
ncbi:uncharacterized protein EI97DRAFT_77142 [Westerdykella ornata]|uniref:Uncharacterized protein n=1 Tax=Westerdykella ornata TaxID=318751 RepID=A0A6A6JFU6_WESOR|nr:uncharacterized protein EI97DRAFT_77142 [Westerdykella ornata]KAF2275500.1 hypothetical protein EI97DRAFT_77142 [Westerdykella ornata]